MKCVSTPKHARALLRWLLTSISGVQPGRSARSRGAFSDRQHIRLAVAMVVALSMFGSPHPCLAQKSHQYQWVGPVNVTDNRQSGVQFNYRKGDNNFNERTFIYLMVHNRYRVKVNVSFQFDLIDLETGKRATKMVSKELGPEQTIEDTHDPYSTPENDKHLGADGWNGARYSIENAKVTQLRMAPSSDPRGQTYEVYPTDELGQKQREAQEQARLKQEEERKQRELQQKELERQQQEAQRQSEERRKQYQADQQKRYEQQLAEMRRNQENERRRQEQRKQEIMRDCEAKIAGYRSAMDAINRVADYLLAINDIKSDRNKEKNKLDYLDLADGSKDTKVLSLERSVIASMKEEIEQIAESRLKQLDADYNRQALADSQGNGVVAAFIRDPDGLERESREARSKADSARSETQRLMEDLFDAKQEASEREQEEKLRAEMEQQQKEWEAQEKARFEREHPELVAAMKAKAEQEAKEKAEKERLAAIAQAEAEERARLARMAAAIKFDAGELAKEYLSGLKDAAGLPPIAKAGVKAALSNEYSVALIAFGRYRESNPTDDAYEPYRAILMVSVGDLDSGKKLLTAVKASANSEVARKADEMLSKLQAMVDAADGDDAKKQ